MQSASALTAVDLANIVLACSGDVRIRLANLFASILDFYEEMSIFSFSGLCRVCPNASSHDVHGTINSLISDQYIVTCFSSES